MTIQTQLAKMMQYFKRTQKSAQHAKERLQIIISHERGLRDKPDYFPMLQKDILEVVSKYINIDQDDVNINLDYKDNCAILALSFPDDV